MPPISKAESVNRNMVQYRRGISTSQEIKPPSRPSSGGRPPQGKKQKPKDKNICDFSLWPEESDISRTDVLSMKLNAFNQANKEIATNLRSWEPPSTIYQDGVSIDYINDAPSSASVPTVRPRSTPSKPKYEPQLDPCDEVTPEKNRGGRQMHWNGVHGAGRPVQSSAETLAEALLASQEESTEAETQQVTYHQTMLLDLAAEITILEQEMLTRRKQQLEWSEKCLAKASQSSSRSLPPWTEEPNKAAEERRAEQAQKNEENSKYLGLSKMLQELVGDLQGGDGTCLCQGMPKGVVCSSCMAQGKRPSAAPEKELAKTTLLKGPEEDASQASGSVKGIPQSTTKWSWAPAPGTATSTILANDGPKFYPVGLGRQ